MPRADLPHSSETITTLLSHAASQPSYSPSTLALLVPAPLHLSLPPQLVPAPLPLPPSPPGGFTAPLPPSPSPSPCASPRCRMPAAAPHPWCHTPACSCGRVQGLGMGAQEARLTAIPQVTGGTLNPEYLQLNPDTPNLSSASRLYMPSSPPPPPYHSNARPSALPPSPLPSHSLECIGEGLGEGGVELDEVDGQLGSAAQ